jgi:hypothetical protein
MFYLRFYSPVGLDYNLKPNTVGTYYYFGKIGPISGYV